MAGLAARTGVGPATVRHYLSLGLLPPAHRAAANRFLYDERHVQTLRIVRLLRERRHLSLPEIRQVLPSLARVPYEEAFRPEMWDQVIEANSQAADGRSPSGRLLAAAIAAFGRYGFAETSVDELCRSAGLAKGSFYRHYRSKEDLFFAAASTAGAEVATGFSDAISKNGAAASDGITSGQAAAALGQALTPYLPLFLDLLALSARRRPGHARVARRVLTGLQEVVRTRLPRAQPGSERAVVEAALLAGVGRLLQDQVPRSGMIDPNNTSLSWPSPPARSSPA